jgi:hypothetical protein
MAYYDDLAALPDVTLVGLYKCDETSGTVAADSHTSNDPLAIVGPVTFNATKLVPSGVRAFGLPGGAGLVRDARIGWSPCTIIMNVRFDDVVTLRQGLLFIGGGAGGAGLILNGNGVANAKISWLEQGVAWSAFSDVVITQGVNYHIIIVVHSGMLVRMFLNGAEATAVFKGVPTDLGTDVTMIGCEGETGGNGIIGAIDDIAVFTGALDPTDVAGIYASSQASGEPVEPTYDQLYSGIRYRHNPTGTVPYTLREGTSPNGDDHYDTPGCNMNARDIMNHFGQTPADWSLNIAIAIEMWRDKWVIPSGGGVAGYHRHSHGIARHAEETGDPASIDAAYMLAVPGSRDNNGLYAHPDTIAFWRARMGYPYNTREQAFELMAMVDASRAGHPKHGLTETWVDVCIEFIDHVASPPEVRFGAFTWGFMIALSARALLNYWFFYRDSAEAPIQTARAKIPAAIEKLAVHTQTNLWWPPGVTKPVAFTGDTWNHGSLKYVWPRGDTPSHQPQGPFTVATVDDWKTFYGPPECSTVDDYYKFSYVSSTRMTGGHFWVKSYVGATRRFNMERTFVPDGDIMQVGDTFSVVPEGSQIAGGGVAPDDGMPFANTMICPIFSWLAWYYTFVDADLVKAAAYLEFYHEMFNGGSLMWGNPWMQKEWNECMYHITSGIGWQIAADGNTDTTFDSLASEIEPTPVTVYTLSGPATGEVDSPSTNFTVTLGSGVVTGTIRITPAASAGTGTFDPTFLDLTQTVRSGTFTFTPTSVGARTITVTDDTGLTDPAGVAYTATAVPDEVETYTLIGPSTGVVGSASGVFTVTLGSGAVAGAIRFVPQSSAGTGTFTPVFLDLDDNTRSGVFTYTATSAGQRTISVMDNAGLTDPAGIVFDAQVAQTAVVTLTAPVPPSGVENQASGVFSIEVTGPISGTVRFTPQVQSGGGGLLIPAFLDLSSGVRSGTFVFVPSGVGFRSIGVANNGGLVNPSPVGYTATAAPAPPVNPPNDSPRPGNVIPASTASGGRPSWIIPY